MYDCVENKDALKHIPAVTNIIIKILLFLSTSLAPISRLKCCYVQCTAVSIVGSLRDRELACSASDRQGSNFESCVWRTVSSQSSHHPQEVLLAQFSLYVHKGGLKPDSAHFIFIYNVLLWCKFSACWALP